MEDIKSEKKYTWRAYLDQDLERPAKIAAIQSGVDVREYLSDILRNNLPEVLLK